MEKPKVHFNSRGESGNIFWIMARVSEAMTDAGEVNDLWKEVVAGTYEQAIVAIRKRVDLIDDDGQY